MNSQNGKGRGEGDLLSVIEEAMPTLSKGQKRIARYIVDNYAQAAYMTAAALGAEVGVSESTVVRFSGELGYSGYPELQAQMRETVRVSLTSVERIHAANHRMEEGEILDRILTHDAERIKSTLENIDRDAFRRAVDMILGAKNIYILGMRSSAVLAEFMNYYFELLFDNVRLIRPAGGSEIFEHLMKMHGDDVFIAISFPRYTTGIVNATGYASRLGAGVIAVTDSASSPIAALADVTLTAKSDMASFVDSMAAPFSLINALIVALGQRRREQVAASFRQLEEIWSEYSVYLGKNEPSA